MTKRALASTSLALLLFPIACSSSAKNDAAPVADSGAPGDDAGVVDAAPTIDASEPPWSGTTVEPGCTTNGCIHSFGKGLRYSQSVLQSHAATGQHVDNGVVVWEITYVSDGVEMTGSVYVPDSAPPADGFRVVVMNQFSSGLGSPCAPSVGELGIGVASPTALRGMITIVPDATTYGGDADKLGVYLAAPIAGRAALDAARAAFHLGPALGLPVARHAIIAGLSQGAHSTMAAAAEMPTYAPALEIGGFAAVAPPANFRASTNSMMASDNGFNWFVAARLLTWQTHYNLSGGSPFRDPYPSQVTGWFSTECEFNGSTGDYSTLPTHFPAQPSAMLSDAFLAFGKNDSWPADWAAIYAQSTPMPAPSVPPIAIWQGSADTTVPQKDTDAYVAQMRATGLTIDYRVVQGSDHGSTALSSFTVQQPASDDVFTWMQQHLAL